jgi:hypothetical protein
MVDESLCSEASCSGTFSSGTAGSGIEACSDEETCPVLDTCSVFVAEVICGSGSCCWGLSEVTSSLATASKATLEVVCKVDSTTGGSPE